MAQQFDSPVDVAADVAGISGLAYMAASAAVALLYAALLNAHALAAWADGLTPSARTAVIVTLSHDLADRTAAGGLDGPRAAMKAQWDTAKAAVWPGQSAAQR